MERKGNRQHESEGLRGNRKHLDKQTQVCPKNPSVQRLHALTVNYNIYSSNVFCTRHFYFTPVLFKCLKMTLSSQCMSGWLRLYVARGIIVLPSGVRKSSTEVFTHHHFNYLLSGDKKQGRSRSIKTGNHPFCHCVTEGVLLFTLFIPLFPRLWCLLAVYASWCLHVSGKPIKS